MHEIIKMSIDTMAYLLLRMPLEDTEEIREQQYANNAYEEVENWAYNFNSMLASPLKSKEEFEIIEVVKEAVCNELIEGIYLEKMDHEEYFSALLEFIKDATGDVLVHKLILDTYCSAPGCPLKREVLIS